MTQDVKQIVAKLTLEEKASLCTGATAWQTVAVERLGVPSITMSDGPHGVRRVVEQKTLGSGSLPATCFPTASALSATWDVDLLHTLGQALGEECIALDVDILLGPGNNMKRTPVCGRNFEYYSEDPYLGGELAAAFIQGVQSKGIGTSLKHFAANNQETKRMSIDAQVDERALRETYLAGFERAVKKGEPWTVMCAYNRLNGPFCSQHRWLLSDVLRDAWGYEGFVVSDWGAVHDRPAALEAGLELEMPGPQPDRVQAVVDAVQEERLAEAVLDRAVERLLTIVMRAAETEKGETTVPVEAHHALARRMAAEAIVLLKNEEDLLPLADVGTIAVIGRSAKEAYFQGGGSSHINPTQVDVPYDELAKLAGDADLTYAVGYGWEPTGIDQAAIDAAVDQAEGADVALLYVALPGTKESEGYDRADIDLTEQQVALIQAVSAVQPRTVVILNNGSAVAMDAWIDDVAAVLEAWMMGQAGGGAIADVLFGHINPSGRLAETFPRRLVDTPAQINFPGENGAVRYGEGLYIGYRYYDEKQMEVLFPFGYGLSYTAFEMTNLTLSSDSVTDAEKLTVSVDVTNVGKRAGKEVVQVYVRDLEARLDRPQKELKGFTKVALEPGETKTVHVELEPRSFAYWDPAYGTWVTESGEFDILVGRSAANIHLSETVHMESGQQLHSLLDRHSTVGEWLTDPRGAVVLQPLVEQMMAQMGQADEEEPSALGWETIELVKHLPLRSILRFMGDQMPGSPGEIVDELLAQVTAADR